LIKIVEIKIGNQNPEPRTQNPEPSNKHNLKIYFIN